MTDITKHEMLAWLDMQRDAVNTEIVFAAPSDQKQYHHNLQIINAITERVKEMTAVEYLEALNEAWNERGLSKKKAQEAIKQHAKRPRQAVEVVKRWKEEQA